jgi:hypothetical protein
MEDIATIYQFFRRTIAAGETSRISVFGNYLTLLSTTGSSNIRVSINGQSEQELPQGLSVELPADNNFKYLEFRNTEAAPVTIEITVSNGKVNDARASANLTTGIEAVRDELKGDTVPENWGAEKIVGLAAVQIIALNANRKACIIQAKASNTDKIYIGFDNTVSTTKWVAELQAGQALVLDDYRGDLYAIANAAAQLVGWGEW